MSNSALRVEPSGESHNVSTRRSAALVICFASNRFNVHISPFSHQCDHGPRAFGAMQGETHRPSRLLKGECAAEEFENESCAGASEYAKLDAKDRPFENHEGPGTRKFNNKGHG